MKNGDRKQAIVRPPKGGKMIYKQSRFSHLAPIPFRVLAAGRIGSGKTSALYSAVTDFYGARCLSAGLRADLFQTFAADDASLGPFSRR